MPIGIPVGRPQTIAVDLAGTLCGPENTTCGSSTNMRIYWDRDRWSRRGRIDGAAGDRRRSNRVRQLLARRGFSAEVRPDGADPPLTTIERVTRACRRGSRCAARYTREGDVRALLTESDDKFVIAKPGDEIALAFDERGMPPLPAAGPARFCCAATVSARKWTSTRPARPVEPLPFHAHVRYPYRRPNAIPTHRRTGITGDLQHASVVEAAAHPCDRERS